jgi:DNA-binding PadR family transcriptional regulator
MSAVFSHGRLRLYLLKLLDDGPKHGYELIRLLENRFHGLYAPSAGTIYPRLARMEADGLITHTASGGRKVYDLSELGRTELRRRASELAALESEIHASVADLAALAEEVEEGVRGSVRDLKRELREAKTQAQTPRLDEWRQRREAWRTGWPPPSSTGPPSFTGPPSGPFPSSPFPPGSAASSAASPAASPAADTAQTSAEPAAAAVQRRAADLAADVNRLVRLGRATYEDLRVAATVLDSVREQLRHILHG